MDTPVQKSEKWENKEKRACCCGRERSFSFALLNIGSPPIPNATHLMGQLGARTFGHWRNPYLFQYQIQIIFWDSLCRFCIASRFLRVSAVAALRYRKKPPIFVKHD